MHSVPVHQIFFFALIALGIFSLYYMVEQSNAKNIRLTLSNEFNSNDRRHLHNSKRYITDRNYQVQDIESILDNLKPDSSGNSTNSFINKLTARLTNVLSLLKTKVIRDVTNEVADEDLEWLDREEGKNHSDYGDGSCGINTDREHWQMMLQKWVQVAKEHKIRYFITAGSLLGAWRNEDAIPYDQDVDIRVHIDDFDKLYLLRVRKLSWNAYDDHECHFYFTRDWRLPYDQRRRFTCLGKQVKEYEGQCSFTDPNARMIFRQWHFDLYAYTTYSDIVKFIPEDVAFEYRKRDIFPLTRCMLMGAETRCPQNPRAILKKVYRSLEPHKVCQNKTWVRKKT